MTLWRSSETEFEKNKQKQPHCSTCHWCHRGKLCTLKACTQHAKWLPVSEEFNRCPWLLRGLTGHRRAFGKPRSQRGDKLRIKIPMSQVIMQSHSGVTHFVAQSVFRELKLLYTTKKGLYPGFSKLYWKIHNKTNCLPAPPQKKLGGPAEPYRRQTNLWRRYIPLKISCSSYLVMFYSVFTITESKTHRCFNVGIVPWATPSLAALSLSVLATNLLAGLTCILLRFRALDGRDHYVT